MQVNIRKGKAKRMWVDSTKGDIIIMKSLGAKRVNAAKQ